MRFYTKFKILLILALSLIISLFTYRYLQSLREETIIVVAAQDIGEREWIKPDMLKEIAIRKSEKKLIAPDSFGSIKELDCAISKAKIQKGSIINRNNDVIIGTRQSFIDKNIIENDGSINDSYFVNKNKRIETVRVDSQGAAGNILKKGDWVDVIFSNTGDSEKSFSVVILQHIEVFEAKKSENSSSDVSQNISLLLTSQQAVDLAYGKRNGKIDLVLNPSDGNIEPSYPSNMKKFIQPYTAN